MDHVYDIDGISLSGNRNGDFILRFEIGSGYENYAMILENRDTENDWCLLRTRNILLDIDYDQDVMETNVIFTIEDFNIIPASEQFIHFFEPPMVDIRIEQIQFRQVSYSFSPKITMVLQNGYSLILENRAICLKDKQGLLLTTGIRFEADVIVFAGNSKPKLIIQEKVNLNEYLLGLTDFNVERKNKLLQILALGSSGHWKSLPELLCFLRSRPKDKWFCQTVTEGIRELIRSLNAGQVPLHVWKMIAFNPEKAIKYFDSSWEEFLPAFRKLLFHSCNDPKIYGIVGHWLAEKNNPIAFDLLYEAFEVKESEEEAKFELARCLAMAGDPRIMPYLLNQIECSLHPPVVSEILRLMEIVLRHAGHLCSMEILQNIISLRAWEKEFLDVTPESQQWDSHQFTGKAVEVDTAALRALAAYELKRRENG